jgi:hypothetical protein
MHLTKRLPVADGDDVLREQCHGGHVRRPDDVAALWDLYVAKVPLLLDVEKGHGVGVAKQQHSGAGVKDLVAVGRLDLLCYLKLAKSRGEN